MLGSEIEPCARCGGRLRVIASTEEPELIERILAHRREQGFASVDGVSFALPRTDAQFVPAVGETACVST